uniref:UPF3 domain-containing protein n=1 Tax=Parascaris equorum TaxID=6256 RepID=A0A914RL65_PAREQ
MTWKELQMQLDPLPETEFIQFVAVSVDAPKIAFPRAYFVFKNDEDIITFRDRFNGYVFIDSQGSESMGLVELAPNPKEKRRTREEERRARLQRLYDKEQREKAERNETKKITEFRNSKFERSALKEKSNDR